jgi:hypothetical protein
MNAKNANSLIDDMDLPVVAPKVETPKVEAEIEEAPNGKKPTKRRKAKPYEALTQMGRHIAEKKAEKKAVRTNGKAPHQTSIGKALKKDAKPKQGAISKKEARTLIGKSEKVKVNKQDKAPKPEKEDKPVKSVEKDGKIIAQGSGVATGSEHCAVCGKKLSRGTSIADGMGPECARQVGRLPAGVTMTEHYETFKVIDEPGKDYIKLQEAGKIARTKGVSGYKFQIAYGGNRMLRPPLNENFRVIVYKNCRYIKKVAVSDKELKALLS